MKMKKYKTILIALIIISLSACRSNDLIDNADDEIIDLADYVDWDVTTHSNTVAPNYSVVFTKAKVLRFDITISSDDWQLMQSDLAANLSSGFGGPAGGAPGGGQGMDLNSDYDPVWVPCSFNFNNTEWYHVGIRFKGNSSLQSAYQSGNKKLSLKLDFDQFEDVYPALKDQRFYGFKQLNLNNNFNDASLMREKVGADLFRQFGLVASHTAFCVVYIDNGTGSQYYGVYALVEEVDDTVVKTQFDASSGNLYKPDGEAAKFASGTYNTDEFKLKTNKDSADYSDVKALYDVLTSSKRTSDEEAWKAKLETILNVDGYLKWLAANTTIQNWDTYGRMTHNYYLYNNPENNLLTWIPWDNNEAFQVGKQREALSLALTEVGTEWPLIRYLISVDQYNEIYKNYLHKFINEVFVPAQMSTTYATYYNLLKEFAYAEESGYTFIQTDTEFDQAVETLKTHAQSRTDAVNNFLN